MCVPVTMPTSPQGSRSRPQSRSRSRSRSGSPPRKRARVSPPAARASASAGAAARARSAAARAIQRAWFARNRDGSAAVDPITLARFPARRAYWLNGKPYDARTLAAMLRAAEGPRGELGVFSPTVPHTRRRLASAERLAIAARAALRRPRRAASPSGGRASGDEDGRLLNRLAARREDDNPKFVTRPGGPIFRLQALMHLAWSWQLAHRGELEAFRRAPAPPGHALGPWVAANRILRRAVESLVPRGAPGASSVRVMLTAPFAVVGGDGRSVHYRFTAWTPVTLHWSRRGEWALGLVVTRFEVQGKPAVVKLGFAFVSRHAQILPVAVASAASAPLGGRRDFWVSEFADSGYVSLRTARTAAGTRVWKRETRHFWRANSAALLKIAGDTAFQWFGVNLTQASDSQKVEAPYELRPNGLIAWVGPPSSGVVAPARSRPLRAWIQTDWE